MRSILTLLVGLMLLATLFAGPTARAAVPVPCGEVAASATGAHHEGDADEVPSDEDGAFPHHHGAGHDHQVAVPAAGRDHVRHAALRETAWPRDRAAAPSSGTDPALRPPRA